MSAQSAPASHTPRPKLDPALLTERAWKIYLAEVSEEGVSLTLPTALHAGAGV